MTNTANSPTMQLFVWANVTFCTPVCNFSAQSLCIKCLYMHYKHPANLLNCFCLGHSHHFIVKRKKKHNESTRTCSSDNNAWKYFLSMFFFSIQSNGLTVTTVEASYIYSKKKKCMFVTISFDFVRKMFLSDHKTGDFNF